jgi:hypothetical protein
MSIYRFLLARSPSNYFGKSYFRLKGSYWEGVYVDGAQIPSQRRAFPDSGFRP